jgi:hypothetical protein
MLFKVPGGNSSDILPGTVTLPFLIECLNFTHYLLLIFSLRLPLKKNPSNPPSKTS